MRMFKKHTNKLNKKRIVEIILHVKNADKTHMLIKKKE